MQPGEESQYYEVDKETGFLTARPEYKVGVSAETKKQFLETFGKSANFTKACKLVGLDTHTVRAHFKKDPVFRQAYRDAVDALCDEREESLFQMGRHNVTAAFGFLKAFRPHIWNDKKIIEQKETDTKLKSLMDVLKQEKKEGRLIDVDEEK